MKLTIKNVTNMIAYTNIPENDIKVPFTWNGNGYKFIEPGSNNKKYHILSFEQIGSKVNLILSSYPDRDHSTLYYKFLDKVINGIKLDKPLSQDTYELPLIVYKGETTNKYLIDVLNKKDKIYLYVNDTGN